MVDKYSLIGPGQYMDGRGVLYKKAGDQYVRIQNKYTEAEDRFVKNQLQKKGRDIGGNGW